MQALNNIGSICKMLERHIERGEKVLAAVSGGMDSMCLLDMLFKTRKMMGFELACLTVDHNIREKESQKDAQFVEDYCKALGIEFYRHNVHPLKDMGLKGFNLEQEARKLRYECFYDIAKIAAADKVATAHHALDNAECVLLNLFRGAGTAGLGAMHKGRFGIIRPLLALDRSDIEKYARANRIPYREDATNFDGDLSRNYIRMEILPRISARFEGAVRNISAMSERAAIDEAFLEGLAGGIVYSDEGVRLPLALLENAAVGTRALKQALKALGIEKDTAAVNYYDCLSLRDKEKGKVILLKYGAEAVRERDCVLLRRRKND